VNESSGAPEILPELSSAAHKFDRKKLEKAPYSHDGKHPGNLFFGYILRLMIFVGTSIIFRKFEADQIPQNTGGRISIATHINGLVDPSVMIKTQRKRIISLGRHDLITGPFIGWWSRRNGAQPVLRKAEMEAGLTDSDFARKINHRSMLTIANCLAGGHGAVIMPEGKSHQDSQLHALRTGAARAALVAAAIASERQNSPPVIQPTGLHWKTHYWFRTNCFVEYSEPIKIDLIFTEAESARLAAGEWIEPTSDAVYDLREEMYNALSPLTPESPDWETFRALKLIANLEANNNQAPITKLSEEVFSARVLRDKMKTESGLQKIIPDAIEAAEILHSHNLDAASIGPNQELKILDLRTRIKAIFGIFLMITMFPATLLGSGFQSVLARYMANNSDEGLDARTTYFFLAGMFSPIIFWPFVSILILLFSGSNMFSLTSIFSFIIINLVFYISSLIFLYGYDLWSDYRLALVRVKLSKSDSGERLNILVKNLDLQLGLLI
jgi:1-acyl-sn-glycerol-3-phosphate acyltransferase